MADVDLVRFAVVVDGGTIPFGRPFDSWAKLRMELLRANVLSPAYLSQAEDKFYRGESWRSPDTVPMTDEQMKEMKLKRQPDQKAISASGAERWNSKLFFVPEVCRDPLRLASSAADGRSSRAGRTQRGT